MSTYFFTSEQIKQSLLSSFVGDALGVPVEFQTREQLKKTPVQSLLPFLEMGNKTGVWSDDSSLILATIDSLLHPPFSLTDLLIRYTNWLKKGEYTPTGKAFGMGKGTIKALKNFENGMCPIQCGSPDERNNGNGALMRALPFFFYIIDTFGDTWYLFPQANQAIFHFLHVTHGHKRSDYACLFYFLFLTQLIKKESLSLTFKKTQSLFLTLFSKQSDFLSEKKHFSRLLSPCFLTLPLDEIKSSGYVIDTIESLFYSLLHTSSLKEALLTALHLGNDTDTITCLTGGIAGLYYPTQTLPQTFLDSFIYTAQMKTLTTQFCQTYGRNG